jgi:hypothetical protein
MFSRPPGKRRRRLVSAKSQLTTNNRRVRFVRFRCYKKCLLLSKGFGDFFSKELIKIANMAANRAKSFISIISVCAIYAICVL